MEATKKAGLIIDYGASFVAHSKNHRINPT